MSKHKLQAIPSQGIQRKRSTLIVSDCVWSQWTSLGWVHKAYFFMCIPTDTVCNARPIVFYGKGCSSTHCELWHILVKPSHAVPLLIPSMWVREQSLQKTLQWCQEIWWGHILITRVEWTKTVKLHFEPNFRKRSVRHEYKLFVVRCGTLQPNLLR